jgi:tetratricopeptide (TPR) repeat protein
MKAILRNLPSLALAAAMLLMSPVHAQDTPSPDGATVALAPADAAATAVADLQTRWAQIKYGLPEKDRPAAFEALGKTADAAVAAHPGDARILIWRGIVLASWGGAKGGLGALSLVRRAKADFEAALAIDPAALAGSAHTSLGSLYYQVPGWPVGFGDHDKAREHLQAGLKLNPDGIDSNYFWGDYLREDGDKTAAIAAFEKALQAAPRAGRESADAGRRAEINAALEQVRG